MIARTRRHAASAALAAALLLAPAVAAPAAGLVPEPPRRGLPRPEAIALPARSPAAAESLAARLGFATVRGASGAWRVLAPLGHGALVWRAPAAGRAGARPLPLTRLLAPLRPAALPLDRWRDADERPLRDPGSGARIAPAHPNGALELAGAFAIVEDFDRTCERWKAFDAECDGAQGRWLPELGGVSRVVRTEGGFYAFVEPATGRGDLVHRLAERGTGWVGFTVHVRDADSTAAFLDRQGVAYVRGPREGAGARLWVRPEHAGGVVVGFAQAPSERAAGR